MNHVAIVREYLDAYSKKDLDAVARLLAEDVTLQDWNGAVEGKAAALEETRKNFECAQSIEIAIRGVFRCEDGVAAQLRIVVDHSIALEVVDVLRFEPGGRIRSIRAYKG